MKTSAAISFVVALVTCMAEKFVQLPPIAQAHPAPVAQQGCQ